MFNCLNKFLKHNALFRCFIAVFPNLEHVINWLGVNKSNFGNCKCAKENRKKVVDFWFTKRGLYTNQTTCERREKEKI